MPTIQEIIDKRKELQKTNPNATNVDARNLLSTTPTTPVQNPPVVPPQQTTPPQTVTWVNGEQFQVAPVNPQTGLSQTAQKTHEITQPKYTGSQELWKVWMTDQEIIAAWGKVENWVQMMPAKEVTTQPTKTEAPIDYNASAGREQEIQKNIAEITKGNPNLLKDRNAFNQAFGYDTADQWKKALLDSAFQGGNAPLNQKDVLNAFISGVNVPEQNTQAYRNAKVQYDTFKKFNAMTPTQLLDNLKQGQIGTEMDALLSQNPWYIEAKQKLAQVQRTASLNRMGQSAIGVINGKEPEDLSDLSKVEAKYNAPPWTNVQAYEQYVTNNEDVKTAGTTLHNIATQISEVTKTYNEALKSLKAQYWDMPASALLTLMSTRTQDTKSLLDSLIDAKTLAQGDFDLAMKMAEGNYGAYQKDLEVQQGIEKEQRTMKNALSLSQAQFDQKLEQNAMMASDPTTAIGNILNQFSELGIIPDRDVAWHVAEQKRLGMTLPEYTQKIIADFKKKPEYQAMSAANMRKLAPEPTKREESDWQIVTIDGKSYERNKYTGETRNISVWGTTNIPDGKSLFDVLGKNVWTYEWNRGYDLAWALGDPLPAGGNWKVKSIDAAWEQVGSIFIGGKGSKPYGNTVVMEDENGNTIRYSHLQDINVQPWDTLSFGAIVGTRGNTGNVLGANWEKLTAEQLKAWRGAHLDVEIKDKNGRLLSQSEQVDFLKSLTGSKWISQSSLPLYRAYMEDWKLPSKDALKWLWMSSEKFVDSAQNGYDTFLASKAQEINSTYPTLQVQFTPSYSTLSATQREKLNESMTKIGDIDMRLEKLKNLFATSGTEVLPTKAKKEMQSLKQQIILKAKEVENLGVLNWPDLWILESLIPETTWIMSGLFSFDENTLTTLNSIQSNYRSDAKTKGINYGAKINFKGINDPTLQTAQTNTYGITWESLANKWKKF